MPATVAGILALLHLSELRCGMEWHRRNFLQ